MKKFIIAVMMIAVLLFALPAAADETEVYTEVDSTVESTEYTTADTVIGETTAGETTVTETTVESETTVDPETTVMETATTETTMEIVESITMEAIIEINADMSFSELVIAISDKLGISIEEAEKMVSDIRELGDKYLSDSDLWDEVTADMDANPARWTVIGLAVALILFLIGLLIKRVISDATAISRLKVAVASIDRALSGDGQADGQGELSILALVNANNAQLEQMKGENNAQLEQLKGENSSLAARTEELTQTVNSLVEAIRKTSANSDTSLKLTEESTLRIMQLLKIMLDRDIPKTSKEARSLWYSATQNRIKEIVEEGAVDVKDAEQDGEAEKAGEKV